MRILICNDDGIDAAGLAFLERAARRLSDDVWVIAPDGKRSGASNSLTLHRPVTLTRVGERRYAASGTPADCVVAAMTGLFRDGSAHGPRPDLVLSGVNEGRNAAEDIAYSGTMAIAREATFWGIPALAFSRTKGIDPVSENDVAWLAGFIRSYLDRKDLWAKEGHWLAFNLPRTLPAKVVPARIGRDKIAAKAEIIEDSADRLVLKTSSARAHTTTPGDENDIIDSGHISVIWFTWLGQSPIPDALAAAAPHATDRT